jgi:hypothetical protein
MDYNGDDEIECRIIESYGIFSKGIKFWNKEVNLVSWNGRPAKIDIRNWQRDHERCGKGIALTGGEAEELVKLLDSILNARQSKPDGSSRSKTRTAGPRNDESSRAGKSRVTGSRTSKSRTARSETSWKPVPQDLKPFYEELNLPFGAGPELCKSARNTLLKKFHPDKNTANIAFATRKTIKIKDAYEKILAWWKESER